MTNEELKNSAEAVAPISGEKLEGVSGGRLWGYYPGQPCPKCGTPLVEDGMIDVAKYKTKCPKCGDFWVYGWD